MLRLYPSGIVCREQMSLWCVSRKALTTASEVTYRLAKRAEERESRLSFQEQPLMLPLTVRLCRDSSGSCCLFNNLAIRKLPLQSHNTAVSNRKPP